MCPNPRSASLMHLFLTVSNHVIIQVVELSHTPPRSALVLIINANNCQLLDRSIRAARRVPDIIKLPSGGLKHYIHKNEGGREVRRSLTPTAAISSAFYWVAGPMFVPNSKKFPRGILELLSLWGTDRCAHENIWPSATAVVLLDRAAKQPACKKVGLAKYIFY